MVFDAAADAACNDAHEALGALLDDIELLRGGDVPAPQRRESDAERADVAGRVRVVEIRVSQRSRLRGDEHRYEGSDTQQSRESSATHRVIVTQHQIRAKA